MQSPGGFDITSLYHNNFKISLCRRSIDCQTTMLFVDNTIEFTPYLDKKVVPQYCTETNSVAYRAHTSHAV